MINVNVPNEWPRRKKIKFLIICFGILAIFLLFNI
jgi:hypothetical protein